MSIQKGSSLEMSFLSHFVRTLLLWVFAFNYFQEKLDGIFYFGDGDT